MGKIEIIYRIIGVFMKIKSIKKIKNIGLLNEIGYTNSDLFLYPVALLRLA